MATLVPCARVIFEERGRYEGAPSTTPYRLSTVERFMRLQSLAMAPNPSQLRRNDELGSGEGEPPQLIDGFAPAGSFSIRAYVNDLIFWLSLSGFTPTFTPGGAAVTGPAQTTVVGVNALNSATLNVVDTSEFESSGTFILGGVATTYTGKTSTSFTGCGNHAATTGGEVVNDNVPAGATKVVFAKRGGLHAKTAQMDLCYPDNSFFVKAQGVGVSQLSMNAAGQVNGTLAALVYARVADPNLTPVLDSIGIPPLRSGNITVSPWLAGAGETDDFNFTVNNGLVARRGLNASFFPKTIQHADDPVMITGTRPAYELTAADIDALLSGQTFAAKAWWKSSKVIGATTYKYRMVVDIPACQYVGGGQDELRRARRFGGSYNWFAAQDETTAKDITITLVGAIGAVETFV